MASGMDLIPFQKLPERYPALNVRTLRNRLKDDDDFRAATLRVGRRILVDRERLERWLESKRQK